MHKDSSVIRFSNFEDLDFTNLMGVYEESNFENSIELYPNIDKVEALNKVILNFKNFLEKDFFKRNKAEYFIRLNDKVEDGNIQYISAARVHRLEDNNILIESMETKKEYRNRGFAKSILRSIVEAFDEDTVFISKISEKNKASIKTHESLGFHQDSMDLNIAIYKYNKKNFK